MMLPGWRWKHCVCLVWGPAAGPQEPLGPGALASLSFASGPQMPFCLHWIRFVWQGFISFLFSLDCYISFKHWHLLWKTRVYPDPRLLFISYNCFSAYSYPLFYPMIGEDTTLVYILWGHCQSPTLGLDGWTKVFPTLENLWGFFGEWGLWWRQVPGSGGKCSPSLIVRTPLCLLITIRCMMVAWTSFPPGRFYYLRF